MVGYERIGHLVAVSALKPSDRLPDLKVWTSDISIDFFDYVKSQVHLNLVDDLYRRPLQEYVKAMRFLNSGDACYKESALRVLRYFYHDMGRFLVKCENDIQFFIQVPDSLGLPVMEYNVTEVRKELFAVIEKPSAEALKKFRFSQLLKLVNSKDELLCKMNSSVVAAILVREESSSELHKIVLRGTLNEN